MEPDAEIHKQTLGQAPGIQSKNGRREFMSKGHQDDEGEILETAEPSLWELMNSRPTAVEPPKG